MQRDSLIAWLAAAAHLVASAAMLFLLRPGLPGVAEDERLAYMATHRIAWLGGWLVWQVTAILLIALYAVLALRFRGVLSIVAVGVAVAGLSIDVSCEAKYMGVLPNLTGDAFAALDRELEVLIGYAANGLYSVALALLLIAGWRALPKSVLALGVPVVVSGFALSIASMWHDARLETITSAILFSLFTLWIVLVALWLRKNE